MYLTWLTFSWGRGLQRELPFFQPYPVLHSAYVPGSKLRITPLTSGLHFPVGGLQVPWSCALDAEIVQWGAGRKCYSSYLMKRKKWRCVNINPIAWHWNLHSFHGPGYHGSRFPHTVFQLQFIVTRCSLHLSVWGSDCSRFNSNVKIKAEP